MIRIKAPNIAREEISYTFHCLFNEFLGIDYQLDFTEEFDFFELCFNGKSVKISNHFFSDDKDFSNYKKSYLPTKIDSNPVSIYGKSLPCVSIYGTSSLTKESETIVLDSDIISSTFFMLTRWEEQVINKKDEHQRFLSTEAIAVKEGFYMRPVVNEYLDILRQLCLFLNPESQFKKTSFTPIFTTDVDELYKWKKFKDPLIWSYKNLLKLNISFIIEDWVSLIKTVFNKKYDPYNNILWLSKTLEKRNIKSFFYVKTPKILSKYDRNRYTNEDIKNLSQCIDKPNQFIGLHPSYCNFSDAQMLLEEKNHLTNASGKEVKFIRQHYLRFDVPTTWQAQKMAGFQEDSTMIYPQSAGFRCGVCCEFPVFDILSKAMLNLRESPLIYMETPYLNKNPKQLVSDFKKVMEQVKKHEGNFVFLWHNGNLAYKKHKILFTKILQLLSN